MSEFDAPDTSNMSYEVKNLERTISEQERQIQKLKDVLMELRDDIPVYIELFLLSFFESVKKRIGSDSNLPRYKILKIIEDEIEFIRKEIKTEISQSDAHADSTEKIPDFDWTNPDLDWREYRFMF